MRILTLGSSSKSLHSMLDSHEILHLEAPLTLALVESFDPDLVISFGYRHIVRPRILESLGNKILNLHISYLPWNRGADPNFWSWLENTPKGVTIHLMDAGLDTGAILFQKEVQFNDSETLASSYEILQAEIVDLFQNNLEHILNLDFDPKPQEIDAGSNHKSADKQEYFEALPKGWQTKCSDIARLETNFDRKVN